MDNPKMIIELLPGGKLNITGPLSDKVLCYGLLELAKEVIRENKTVSPQQIIPVAAMPLPLGR